MDGIQAWSDRWSIQEPGQESCFEGERKARWKTQESSLGHIAKPSASSSKDRPLGIR
jgi:hypothetical protein